MDPISITSAVISFIHALQIIAKCAPIVKAGIFENEAVSEAIGRDAEALEATLDTLEQLNVSIPLEIDASRALLPSDDEIVDWAHQLHEIAQRSKTVVQGVQEHLTPLTETAERRPKWFFGIKNKYKYDKWTKEVQTANSLLGMILGPTNVKNAQVPQPYVSGASRLPKR